MLVLERFISTPEATFGMLLVGIHPFFTQEPPMHLCLPSGGYPMRRITENGITYIMKNGSRAVTVATYLKADPATHLFVGRHLSIVHQNDDPMEMVVTDKVICIGRFARWMQKMENPEITIRWLGE